MKNGDEVVKRFAQGSDGKLEKYTPYYKPVFEATIGSEGEVNIVVPIPSRLTGILSSIPTAWATKLIFHLPTAMSKKPTKRAKTFQTRSKLLEGTITGFTADGRYTVSYTTPAGEATEDTVDLRTIRKANNPHWFKPSMDYFSDVNINVETDADLKAFWINQSRLSIDICRRVKRAR